jgi:hypothetical protein
MRPVETTLSSRIRTLLVVRLTEKRDRFELVATVNALPEIRCPAWSILKPNRRGDQAVALRTRILVGQIIRYGSDHDASPICFAAANCQRAQLAENSHCSNLTPRSRQIYGIISQAKRRTIRVPCLQTPGKAELPLSPILP